MVTTFQKWRLAKPVFFILFLTSGQLLSQSPVEIDLTAEFTNDTTWVVGDLDLELDVDWIEFNQGYLLFGGKFVTSFENFTNHVDSIVMDAANWCNDCFDVRLYKDGETTVSAVYPLGQSVQTIINPWTENPDSLVLWTFEGGVKSEKVYFSDAPTEQSEIEQEEFASIYPNPASDYFRFKQLKDNAVVKIFNTSGSLLFESRTSKIDNQINISSLSNGIYVVKIENGGSAESLKLIKVGAQE